MVILCIRPTIRSAIEIGRLLSEMSGKNIKVTTDPTRVDKLLIRYGNTLGNFYPDTNYNSVDFINLCANKLRFSQLMGQHGFYSPVYHKENPAEDLFPVIVRQSLTSTGGRGIIICKDINEFNKNFIGGYWWTPFVKLDFELRVHILGGEIKRVLKKIKDNGEEDEFPIRNVKNGYSYYLKNISHYKKLIPLVDELTDLFGTDYFYGMDIGWDSSRREYFIIELNSAPSLNSNTVQVYAQYFYERIFK